MKKAIVIVVVLVLVITAFASCGKPEDKLIGTWKGSVKVALLTTEYEITFNEDGTGKISSGSLGVDLNYTVTEENKLSITANAELLQSILNEFPWTCTFTVEKDTLTLTSGDNVVTLTKVK